MLFKTSEKYEELRKAIREFAETEVKPIAFQLDQNNEFPHDIVKMMGEHGWMGIPYAQEYGGAGSDALAYAIAVEELSRVDGGVGVILSAHTSLGSYPIEAFGTEEQKQKYLVPLASGEKLGAFGLTEPEAGSDAGGTQTTAELDGDYYILNGNKIFITNAPEADTYVVFAVTTPGIGTKGISAFIVEKGWEGFSFGDPYDKLGIRSSKTAELIFDNVKVPKENLLGQEGQGFRIAMQTLDGGRIGIAAQALGIAQGAYEAALQYSKERVQFGRPISQLQSIQFKFADMATKLRCARFLIYSAAELKSNHEPYGMEAAMAKMYASDIALEVTNDALQIHGGNGYLKGMEVERFYRDAKITTIYEGTNEIQRVVIGSYLIPRPKSNKKAKKAVAAKPEAPITGERKRQMIKADTPKEAVDELLAALKKDGYDFTVGIDVDTPIVEAERVISVGKGIGGKENMELARETAKAFGGALGSSRPVAETMKLLPLERYVGMSGQKFKGNLYVAFGISGASQHLKGIKDAATIVAVNKNANAPIFKNADYGIVGDMLEIMPLIIEALGTEGKGEAPEFKRVRRSKPRKLAPTHGVYVCTGCGYEYVPDLGDPEGEIEPGTTFEALPDSWICPECQKEKSQFVKEEFPKDRQ
ncbi:acyl-CoA dehydrogenase family protein [Peptoniphilus equinus]|uniref:Acyl-CoA dehydrogenase family protein n=1 Tax=Peptoniphilus equinus TaxID=3016343 RepID=A0ABY7QVF0_9FIRM|nr:acyl-CoA dehydrogenase family protein [Peptoniphilus equinus]WBW50762.1 acyl-CoA dehydrogenase family protein [Peptoniphilus equinus]